MAARPRLATDSSASTGRLPPAATAGAAAGAAVLVLVSTALAGPWAPGAGGTPGAAAPPGDPGLVLAATLAPPTITATTTAAPSPPAGAPTASATSTEGTPIVEPDPDIEALVLPVALQGHDYRAPGPLPAVARGYLRRLTPLGRDACRPATHLISDAQDGPPLPVAVVYSRHGDDPTLELDLYLGSMVKVTGVEDLAPPACTLSGRLLGVDKVTVIDEPGQGPPPSRPVRNPRETRP